jgi:hypothetical protein
VQETRRDGVEKEEKKAGTRQELGRRAAMDRVLFAAASAVAKRGKLA